MAKFSDGSFRQVSENLLQYRFYHQKKRISVYGYTEQECYQKRVSYIANLKKKPKKEKDTNTPSGNWTYQKWSDYWILNYKQDVRASTMYQINLYLKNYICPKIGNIQLKNITGPILQEIIANVNSPSKKSKIGATLSDSFHRATVCRLITYNPYEAVEFKHYENPELGALTHKQQIDLIALPKDKIVNDLIIILLLTGMRQGELLALQPSDIDIREKTISITKTKCRQTNQMNEPKTKAGKRIIPIEQEIIDILIPYMKNKMFGEIYHSVTVQNKLSEYIKRIDQKYSGHILRHTFITNAYELNFPPYIVKKIAGHSSIDQAITYLDIRKSSDFIETDVVKYMRKIKARYSVE